VAEPVSAELAVYQLITAIGNLFLRIAAYFTTLEKVVRSAQSASLFYRQSSAISTFSLQRACQKSILSRHRAASGAGWDL
jgi:hypothetical protein